MRILYAFKTRRFTLIFSIIFVGITLKSVSSYQKSPELSSKSRITPLRRGPDFSDDDILKTVAVFRFVHPKAVLRFAGGRDLMTPKLQRKAIYTGVNGSIMGDLLTTIGSKIAEDKKMVEEMGYEF